MWGEVLAAFVGAISGGAVLALLTWRIYRREKLAQTIQIVYSIRDVHRKMLRRLENLDYEIEAFLLAKDSDRPFMNPFNHFLETYVDVQPYLTDLRSLLVAHFPASIEKLESLIVPMNEYYDLVHSYVNNYRHDFFLTFDEKRFNTNKNVNANNLEELAQIEYNLSKDVDDLITTITLHNRNTKLHRLSKMLIFLDPERW